VSTASATQSPDTHSFRLEGAVDLITGGATGRGLGIARGYVKAAILTVKETPISS